MSVQRVDYIVLRCADLQRSRAFYEALGFQLAPEQHGSGSRHLSATIGEFVLELYPSLGTPTSGVRLGLRASDLRGLVEAVRGVGGQVVRFTETGAPTSAVVRDPDGNEVSLVQE